jgi:ABC-type Fe3+ transport system permease subunit
VTIDRVLGVACLIISASLLVLAVVPRHHQRDRVWSDITLMLVFLLLFAGGMVVGSAFFYLCR